VGFAFTVEKARLAVLLLFAAQTGFQSAFGKALTHTIDREWGDPDGLSDVAILFCAACLVFIGQEQDAGAFAFPFGAALGLAPTGKCFAFSFG
jgi:hypothetical protein